MRRQRRLSADAGVCRPESRWWCPCYQFSRQWHWCVVSLACCSACVNVFIRACRACLPGGHACATYVTVGHRLAAPAWWCAGCLSARGAAWRAGERGHPTPSTVALRRCFAALGLQPRQRQAAATSDRLSCIGFTPLLHKSAHLALSLGRAECPSCPPAIRAAPHSENVCWLVCEYFPITRAV